MKINQVEELTGITKKNIRFYEEEGLISPNRDPANGYREYSLSDVDDLNRIRLLRKLDVSCEEIRKIQEGTITLKQCMDDHLIRIAHRRQDLNHHQEICEQLMSENSDFSQLDAAIYLEEMKQLEKGGTKFMNVRESDVRKRRNGAIIAAAVCILFFLILLIIILWADKEDPAPKAVLIFMIVMIASVIIGIIMALRQRLSEVQKGEIDEASKY